MKLQETELTENAIQLTQDELLITKDEANPNSIGVFLPKLKS
jgi:hypothetical protein